MARVPHPKRCNITRGDPPIKSYTVVNKLLTQPKIQLCLKFRHRGRDGSGGLASEGGTRFCTVISNAPFYLGRLKNTVGLKNTMG